MRIKKIINTGRSKLILAANMGHMSGKPVEVSTVFMDYEGHTLRYFTRHGSYNYFAGSFKEALKAILSDTITSLVQIS